ncbi:dual specificity phosphatase DUPD1 [Caerostris extrusa]|uniref:Dual specificity phosphatase DUPD1 n=1 Tax=Caerostris extrusa TaxID=172846 RepID=A0AAV4SU06_CAEEX|nr:dual specificity phosphatase DUPD1 [Caerostris extrusa]
MNSMDLKNLKQKDASVQIGPKSSSHIGIKPSFLKISKQLLDRDAKKEIILEHENEPTSEDETQNFELLINNVSVQSTTGEATNHKTYPTPYDIQKMFIRKIMPYYASLEKKARKLFLKMIYGITSPPAVRSFGVQVDPEELKMLEPFEREKSAKPGLKLKSEDDVRKYKIAERKVSVEPVSKEDQVAHESISVQADLDVIYKLEKVDVDKRLTSLEILQPVAEEKIEVEKPEKEDEEEISVESKGIEDLKNFLLDKDVWQIIFWPRRDKRVRNKKVLKKYQLPLLSTVMICFMTDSILHQIIGWMISSLV